MEQIILHVDTGAFYASVEMRDDPALRGERAAVRSFVFIRRAAGAR